MNRAIFVWALALLLGYNFENVQSSEKKGSPPVSVEVSPAEVKLEGTSAEVTVKWCIGSHVDNNKFSFVMTGTNGEFKFIEGDAPKAPVCGESVSLLKFEVKSGHYIFEACVYRRTQGKELRLCDGKSREVK